MRFMLTVTIWGKNRPKQTPHGNQTMCASKCCTRNQKNIHKWIWRGGCFNTLWFSAFRRVRAWHISFGRLRLAATIPVQSPTIEKEQSVKKTNQVIDPLRKKNIPRSIQSCPNMLRYGTSLTLNSIHHTVRMYAVTSKIR